MMVVVAQLVELQIVDLAVTGSSPVDHPKSYTYAMRKEIEVKARVRDLEAVATKLVNLGCSLSEPMVQDDTIFINFDGEYTDYSPGTNFLRLRRSKGKVLFTIKQPQSNELDCIEHETEIADPEEFAAALLLMGYREVMRYSKSRRKANYREYEICLDEVSNLGTFVEVEKITETEDAETVQNELFNFLESLGARREDRIVQGYDTLFFLKNIKA